MDACLWRAERLHGSAVGPPDGRAGGEGSAGLGRRTCGVGSPGWAVGAWPSALAPAGLPRRATGPGQWGSVPAWQTRYPAVVNAALPRVCLTGSPLRGNVTSEITKSALNPGCHRVPLVTTDPTAWGPASCGEMTFARQRMNNCNLQME